MRNTMNNAVFISPRLVATGLIALLPVWSVCAELPQRDLVVEMRQVEEAERSGYAVGTQARTTLLAPQQVQVRNGEKASLSLGKSMPIQWVQSVSSQSTSLSTKSASASGSSGAVTNAVTWMDAGQSLKVQPRWPGKQQPVTVAVEMQSASVGDRTGADLPEQSRSQVATTVTAPLGQWVTVAATGTSQPRGVYGSEAGSNTRLLLQIRVLAP
jgi:Bacterial type II and III secretion system protein